MHLQRRESKSKFFVEIFIFLVFCSLVAFASCLVFFPRYETLKSERSQSVAVSDLSTNVVTESEKLNEVMGFLPSWTPVEHATKNIDKMTQVIYFGLGVNSNGEIVKYNGEGDPVIEWNVFTSSEFENLKEVAKSKDKKIILAIKNFDNESIDTLISNQNSTNRFAKELVELVREYKLDGVNIDFEYVTDTDFPTRPFFNKFLSTIDVALNRLDPKLLLSVDINPLGATNDAAYDMPKIAEIVDYIIIMGYDYSRAPSTRAGPVAPLYAAGDGLSVSRTVTSLARRVSYDKVILGIPFYGYEWATYNRSYGSESYPGSGALATYKRVMQILDQSRNVRKYWDVKSQEPWLVYKDGSTIKQIHYEDDRSIALKVGFVRDHAMAGVAIWALGYEGDHQDIWKVIY